MAFFNKREIIEMHVEPTDIISLECFKLILEPIMMIMDEECADYLESIETGEIIEYDEIKTTLRVIEGLIDKHTGRKWRLV